MSRALLAVAVALALGGAGCNASGGPAFVGVLSLSVTTQSGPTTIAGNVPAPCELDLDFGSVPLGYESAGTVEIVNHDAAAVSFSPFGADVDPEFGLTLAVFRLPSLQPGGSVSFPLTFQPTRSGTASSSFSIPTSLGHGSCGSSGAVVIKLTGTGTADGSLVVTPKVLDFGNVLVNSTTSKSVTLGNASATAVSSITCAVSGVDTALFTVSGCPKALAAGATATLVVSFAPLALETRSVAQLTFTGEDSPPATLDLAGEPTDQGLAVTPNPLDFGYVPPGATALDCSVVSNQLGVPITIGSISDFADDGAFSLSQVDDATPPNPITFPIALAGGQSSKVCFVFAPSITQSYMGVVTLATNDTSGNDPIVQLTGWGGGPQISCLPSSVDFGQTPLDSTATRPVICTNTGSAIPLTDLVIDPPTASPIAFGAQFDQTTDVYPLDGLLPGASTRIDVTYDPVATGSDQGTLSIKSNGGRGQTVLIPLTGEGLNIAPCQIALLPGESDFGNVRAGQVSATMAFEIENLGTDICLVQNPLIQDDASGSFHILSVSIQPDPVSGQITIPAPGPGVTSALTVALDFAPTVAGFFSGEVGFVISNPAQPNQVVPLKGTSESTCLTVEPASLQFGTLGQDLSGVVCGSSSRSFTVFNTCDSQAVLSSATVESGPGDQAPQFALEAGLTFPVTFEASSDLPLVYSLSFDPTTVGPHTAELLISDGTVETPISLSGDAVASTSVTDQFTVALPEADVLFVMDVGDDPASQTSILNAAPGFFRAASGVDYRVAVTTDNDYAADATAELGRLLPCPTCSIKGSAPTIISPSSVPDGGSAADPAAAFTQLYGAVPNNAYPRGEPSGLHVFLALYNALQNDPAPGIDFFRPGASFAAITTNDDNEDDSSQLGAGRHDEGWFETFFEAYFMSQPGFSWSYVSSETTITGTGFIDPTQLPVNIGHMLTGTGGIAVNTADPSWQTALGTFWEAISETSSTFWLSGIPAQGQSSISVAVDGVSINQLAGPGNPNWTYRSDLNAVQFTSNYSPKSGDAITVAYQVCNQ